jgi:hypothetical protein
VAGVGHLVLAWAFSSCSSEPSDVVVGLPRGLICSVMSYGAGLRRYVARWGLGRWGHREVGGALGMGGEGSDVLW